MENLENYVEAKSTLRFRRTYKTMYEFTHTQTPILMDTQTHTNLDTCAHMCEYHRTHTDITSTVRERAVESSRKQTVHKHTGKKNTKSNLPPPHPHTGMSQRE